jgi:hypothetical protein
MSPADLVVPEASGSSEYLGLVSNRRSFSGVAEESGTGVSPVSARPCAPPFLTTNPNVSFDALRIEDIPFPPQISGEVAERSKAALC